MGEGFKLVRDTRAKELQLTRKVMSLEQKLDSHITMLPRLRKLEAEVKSAAQSRQQVDCMLFGRLSTMESKLYVFMQCYHAARSSQSFDPTPFCALRGHSL